MLLSQQIDVQPQFFIDFPFGPPWIETLKYVFHAVTFYLAF